MVFKRSPRPLGVGGPTAVPVLDPGAVRPGGVLSGRVDLVGGTAGQDVEHVALELVAHVGDGHAEAGDEDGRRGLGGAVVFERHGVGGPFRPAAGERRGVPFSLPLPWETPATGPHGRHPGAALGVRTELVVAGAAATGDPVPLAVAPLPAQEAVLEALGRLGFAVRSAGLEHGRVGGTGQRLPFRQRIELAAPQGPAEVAEVELTFLAVPGALEVVLEADRRGGAGSGGHDAVSRFTVPHDGPAGPRSWTALVDGWIRELAEHRASYDLQAVYGHGPGQPSAPRAR
ncbi:sporulation protein [Streptomyces sp. NPDC059459]|uniref:sporulation protein n=1 Tax=Streptomyces sp. NPDC059459 TaxID=3346839 RepID=UPI0036ADC94B